MTSLIKHNRRHDLLVSRNGRIDIMARVARALSIHPGDAVNIARADGEHYIYVASRADDSTGRHEAACRPTKPRSRNYRAYSRTLAHALLAMCGEAEHAGLWCGDAETLGDGRTAMPIITGLNTLAR